MKLDPDRLQTLASRIRQCARLTGTFTLRSGKVSDTYFDKYQFEADPETLRAIATVRLAVPRPCLRWTCRCTHCSL